MAVAAARILNWTGSYIALLTRYGSKLDNSTIHRVQNMGESVILVSKGGGVMDAKKTGLFIAQLRKELGLTQKELADALKVSDKAVSRWETGKGFPDTTLLTPLGEILGVSVGELLAGERMEDTDIRQRTDEVIVETLRKPDRKWTFLSIAAAFFAALILILALDLVPWQWRTVLPIRSNGYDLKINKLTQTITDGTTVCDYTVSEENGTYFIGVTYPDGSTYAWSYYYRKPGRLVRDVQTSVDYDEAKYLPGDALVLGLKAIYFTDFGSHASMEQLTWALWGMLLIPLGIVFLFFPDRILLLLFGWIFNKATFSRGGIAAGYVMGTGILCAGLVLLIGAL